MAEPSPATDVSPQRTEIIKCWDFGIYLSSINNICWDFWTDLNNINIVGWEFGLEYN